MQDNGSTIAVNSVEESEQLQSAIAGYIVYGFEILLVIILVGIAIYLFSSKRQKSVESPKYRMMEDDDDNDESK